MPADGSSGLVEIGLAGRYPCDQITSVPFQSFFPGTRIANAPPSRVPLQVDESHARFKVTFELSRTAFVWAGTEVDVHAETPAMTAMTATIDRTLIALPVTRLPDRAPSGIRVATKILPSAGRDVAILVGFEPRA